MLGGLDRPTRGTVTVDGRELSSLRDEELTIFRRRKIGFVFQNFNLVPVLNVMENIVLPIRLDGKQVDEAYVQEIIRVLGLEKKLNSLPNNLSGGQQQRVAIARALAAKPAIILADEPTDALDSKSSDSLLELFNEINRGGQTIVMVTHSTKAASHAGRVLFIQDGTVFHQIYRGNSTEEQQFQKISDTLTLLMAGGEDHA